MIEIKMIIFMKENKTFISCPYWPSSQQPWFQPWQWTLG
jgi:hypothetical protein